MICLSWKALLLLYSFWYNVVKYEQRGAAIQSIGVKTTRTTKKYQSRIIFCLYPSSLSTIFWYCFLKGLFLKVIVERIIELLDQNKEKWRAMHIKSNLNFNISYVLSATCQCNIIILKNLQFNNFSRIGVLYCIVQLFYLSSARAAKLSHLMHVHVKDSWQDSVFYLLFFN